MSISDNIIKFKKKISSKVKLIAVSKTKSIIEIKEAYDSNHKLFGENKVQEMTEKWKALPKDIEWHMIGHLQKNKVKYIAPYVSLIHSVDSIRLLNEINKQAKKNNRIINCLIQVNISEEQSKFGLQINNLPDFFNQIIENSYESIEIIGLMGMASFTENEEKIFNEFTSLKEVFINLKGKFPRFSELSIGMSSDYKIALKQGSTMIRIGSKIFGYRN
jgi:pyridoxal phosphate enzyme (YggS family)|tara:strand:- start:45 stop:698 length:654 start_codon:yes stop_codon:yes gene_type:complete